MLRPKTTAFDKTKRMAENRAVAESVRTRSLSWSLFPFGTNWNFSLSFPVCPSVSTAEKFLRKDDVCVSRQIRYMNFCEGKFVTIFLLRNGFVQKPSWNPFQLLLRTVSVSNCQSNLLQNILFTWLKLIPSPTWRANYHIPNFLTRKFWIVRLSQFLSSKIRSWRNFLA